MEMRYGTLWIDRYGFLDRSVMAKSWAEDLCDLAPFEISRGLDSCKTKTFPPSCPEFREMCRPTVDYSEADVQSRRIELAEQRWAEKQNMITDSCSKEKSMEKLEEIRKLMGMRNKVDS